jgi:hypothetical protein
MQNHLAAWNFNNDAISQAVLSTLATKVRFQSTVTDKVTAIFSFAEVSPGDMGAICPDKETE